MVNMICVELVRNISDDAHYKPLKQGNKIVL